MATGTTGPRPKHWQVTLVGVRTRDGPHRLEHVYRILLGPRGPGSNDNKEGTHASSDLRPGVHGAPGARADYREPGDGAPALSAAPSAQSESDPHLSG